MLIIGRLIIFEKDFEIWKPRNWWQGVVFQTAVERIYCALKGRVQLSSIYGSRGIWPWDMRFLIIPGGLVS
jgi:hypothetical protein